MYKGRTADLPAGQGGYDGNQNVYQIPANHLVKARNIRFDGYTWKKAPGLALFDTNKTSNANAELCYTGIDWRPTQAIQRQITVWSDGTTNANAIIYKEVGGNIDQVTLASGLTINGPVTLVEGGFEDAGENRKLYVFSKSIAPLQLDSDAATMTGITAESADWATTKPSSAIYHDARIYAFGVDSAPHNFYISSLNDHGDFNAGDSRVYQIAPGRGDYLAAAWSYLPNNLYVFKYPRGIWSVDTTDVTGFYLPINKVRDDVGMSGPHGICKVDQDVVFISSSGRLFSLTALQLGTDPTNADITAKLKLTTFIQTYVDADRLEDARLVYDEIRKELHYIFTSKGGSSNDMSIVIDLNEEGNPKVAIEDRGHYFQAVWPRIGSDGFIELLCAGSGGFVYRMNSPVRSIAGTTAYMAEFQYADTDFDFVAQNVYKPFPVGSLLKRFDFMEIAYIPTGTANMSAEFIVDGRTVKTVNFDLGSVAGSIFDSALFDTDSFDGTLILKHRIPIGATGNMFSVRFWNNELNEDFTIINVRIFFKPQGNIYEA